MASGVLFIRACPTCGRNLQIRIELLNRAVQCCHCEAEFIASERKEAPWIDQAAAEALARAQKYIDSTRQAAVPSRGETSRYDPGRYDPGRYETGRYETGRYETGRYETGRYETGRYEPGRYEPGGYVPGRDEPGITGYNWVSTAISVGRDDW